MPIPNNELFVSFLSRTKLVRLKPEGPSVAFTTGAASLSEQPVTSQSTVLYLSYPEFLINIDKKYISRLDSETRSSLKSKLKLVKKGYYKKLTKFID